MPSPQDASDTQKDAQSLYQLLGAPLYALIEAETYAANATADFIERVGFEPPPTEGDEPSAPGHLGKLRTLTFRQERRAEDGQGIAYRVEVPLLSLLPIPALQIKEADLEFYVKIINIQQNSRAGPKRIRQPDDKGKEDDATRSQRVPTPPLLDMKAMLGRGQPNAPNRPESAFDMQVHIKIKVAQADPPAGLARLFNLMEQSISSTKE